MESNVQSCILIQSIFPCMWHTQVKCTWNIRPAEYELTNNFQFNNYLYMLLFLYDDEFDLILY